MFIVEHTEPPAEKTQLVIQTPTAERKHSPTICNGEQKNNVYHETESASSGSIVQHKSLDSTENKTDDQKVEILCKLFPMLTDVTVQWILKSCGGEISKSIEYILSKNMNDTNKTCPSMITPSMMVNSHFLNQSSFTNTNAYLNNVSPLGRLRPYVPMTSHLPFDSFRSPWTFYCRLQNFPLPLNITPPQHHMSNRSIDETCEKNC